MKSQILIFTSSFDKTCDYLIQQYKSVTFFRFNLDLFSQYQVVVDNDGFKITNQYSQVTTATCKSIYYRKPALENLDGVFDAQYHSFAHKEALAFIEGIAESFDGICLSRPSIMRKANNKIYQAVIAKGVGLNLPNMAVTNNLSQMSEVNVNSAIVKPIATGLVMHGAIKEFVQTNKFNPDFESDSLKYAPAYFQDFINKDYEVRVTFVGERAFPVKILSENNIDWRKPNNKVKYINCEIPGEIYSKCILFMNACDMQFGCFDFIVKDDEWFFLEMNANGQWAWLQFETGIDIASAIVGFLDE